MPKYRVYAVTTITKYYGAIEANSEEDAKNLSGAMDDDVVLCWQCTNDAGEVDCTEVHAREL